MKSQTIRAVIAEDDSLVADVIEEELSKLDVVVVGRAADGRQAVEETSPLAPDVVLMDVEMPEMDGIDAAREIQERCPTPVVMLTVYSSSEVAARAAAAGAGAYVVKPPCAEELERAIFIARARFDDLMELRKLNEELSQALETVTTLSGLLPICTHYKKIRDDRGYWHPVEAYIRDHSSAQFSHGVCPECPPKVYPREEYPCLYERDDSDSEDAPR